MGILVVLVKATRRRPSSNRHQTGRRPPFLWQVRDQGMLLTSGRLPLQKQQALASVGITLKVDMRIIERNVQLQVGERSSAHVSIYD